MKHGFTIIETLIVIAFIFVVTTVIAIQVLNIEAMHRDEDRKTAINTIFYALENSFYAANKYYPETISESNLTVVDQALFTDPSGRHLGEAECDYVYIPANCDNGHCQEYTLKAKLEKETEYIKKNV
jgi:type II secretory pathway pseudopilin PulG